MHSVSRENPVVAARELYSGLGILRARMGGILGRGLRPTNEIVANEGAPGDPTGPGRGMASALTVLSRALPWTPKVLLK